MNFKIIKSYAKINLSLGVTGKLKSGYHKIETLVSFINLYDKISIKKINRKNHKIFFYGKFSKGIKKNNTIFNILKILDKKKLLNGQKFFIKIQKNIPQKSGLGGGSINASSIIKYLVNKNIIYLSKRAIEKLTNKIGSDVKLGLDYKNKILYSNGKLKKILKKKRLFVIIIKPNFGCSTSMIYKKVKKFTSQKLKTRKKEQFSLVSILKLENDLEKIAFKVYPKLNHIKLFMETLPNIKLARMTGSGSSIVGYFKTKNSAINGAKIFKKKYKNYWCIVSKTI